VFESTRAQSLKAAKPQDFGTVKIGIFRMATRLANKLALGFAICFFCVATLIALPTGIPRIDVDHRNSSNRALVSQEGTQLSECPAMQPCSLALPSPDPRSDASQFLDGNSTIRAFCGLNDAFGNYVIAVSGKVAFPATAFLQKTLGGFRALALELSPKGTIPVANLVEMGAGVIYAIAVVSDLDDPKINAKAVNRRDLLILWNLNGDIQKPLTLTENQVGLTPRKEQQGPLLLPADKQHLLSPPNRPDAHGRTWQVNGEHTTIVGDASALSERALSLFVEFIGVSYLGDEQAGSLSGQWKLVSNLAVVSFVKWKSAELLRIPSQFRKSVTCGVHGFQSTTQSRRLFGSRKQFNLDSQFHFLQYLSKV
jgi:hypothetical protein